MKKLITILFVCLLQTSFATTYYVSNSGSDANAGTSISMAWQTITKVNATTFSPGDNILFKKGDTFYGKIIVMYSGTSGNLISYGAYGTGGNPIITGFKIISSWSDLGGNVWESTNGVSTLPYTNMVSMNGINTPMGKTPNNGFYTFESHTTSGSSRSITSSNLTGTPNWTGAELATHVTTYTIGRYAIQSQSSGTLNYIANSGDEIIQSDNQDFIIQNDIKTLDLQNEWYYNPSTKKLTIYSTSTPDNVKISSLDTLVVIKDKNYVTIESIDFEGGGLFGVFLLHSGFIKLDSCRFNFIGRNGIWGDYGGNSEGVTVSNSQFQDINNTSIWLEGDFVNAIVRNNTIKNTGLIFGMLNIGGGSGVGIIANGPGSMIDLNEIDSSGYSGIIATGASSTVDRNYVRSSCSVIWDGGGIYTGGTRVGTRNITNNIVIGSDKSNGIYCDDLSNDVQIYGNTVAYSNLGIFLNNTWDISIKDNTLYGNGGHTTDAGNILINDYQMAANSYNIRVAKNILFSKNPIERIFHISLKSSTLESTITLDSNYYAKPINPTGSAFVTHFNYDYLLRTFPEWRTFSSQDNNSILNPREINSTDSLRFEYNATDNPITVSLDQKYIDVKDIVYDGSIILQPWRSAVLIKDGPATDCCAGIEEEKTIAPISIFPNPVNDYFTVEGATQISSIKVVDLSGRTMKTFKPTSSNAYSISGLASGAYLVVITDGSSEVSKHIVKQ